MRRFTANAIGAALSLTLASTVHAFCSESSAPSSWSTPTKPIAPYCVNEWDKTHTCDSWEIESYNGAIRSYNIDVEQYVDDLKEYVEDAIAYAKCEIANLD